MRIHRVIRIFRTAASGTSQIIGPRGPKPRLEWENCGSSAPNNPESFSLLSYEPERCCRIAGMNRTPPARDLVRAGSPGPTVTRFSNWNDQPMRVHAPETGPDRGQREQGIYQFGFRVTVTTAQKTRGCTGPMAGDSKRVYALRGKEEWRVPEGCQRF